MQLRVKLARTGVAIPFGLLPCCTIWVLGDPTSYDYSDTYLYRSTCVDLGHTPIDLDLPICIDLPVSTYSDTYRPT